MRSSKMHGRLEEQLEELFNHVSAQVSPLPEEAAREKQFALSLVKKLEAGLQGEGVRVYFVGSAARDTGLRGDRDIDLFVSFPQKHSRDFIVEKTISATKSSIPGSWEMHYAEHPYLQAKLVFGSDQYSVEVIPCFQISPHEGIKSAVDRSPLHMDYLQKRLNFRQKRDVRVLKLLLKRAGIYGAEARIGGFSGLVCEYLILNYRSLLGLLENACKWKPPAVVDIEGSWVRGKNNPKQKLGEVQKQFPSPLVIIDAIDKRRNAAAAVSLQSLACFVSLSQAFLADPSEEFFFPPVFEPAPPEQIFSLIRSRGSFLCLLEMPAPKVVEDILFPQARKTLNSLCALLQKENFGVIDSADFVAGNKLFFVLELASEERSPVKVFAGPPAWDGRAGEKFVSAHPKKLRGPFVRDERVVLEEKQETVSAKQFLQQLLEEKGNMISVGSKLEGAFKRAKLISGKEIVSLPSEALLELQKYLKKKEFWL